MVAESPTAPCSGRGECVPYARYGETRRERRGRARGDARLLAAGLDRQALQAAMPAGAARNALDCAFWDLEAKTRRQPAHALAGLPAPRPLTPPIRSRSARRKRWARRPPRRRRASS